MALTFGFYDSLNHDRLYNAQQMSAIFDGIINDGVFASVGSHFSVVPGTGMHVLVKSGRAWFNSTWTLNDSDIDLTIDAADTLLGRIDTVVLEVNSEQATRANSIKVVKGTAASSPVKPTLTNTATVHQHPLAHITVAKNTTAITASMIEIVVGKTDCPFVTAILQTTDITNLFAKWENDFQTWFSTVRSTLDGDVALNLQNQIDANWRNTLKDATKTKLGLASNAVPDDAFNALLTETTKVLKPGDMLVSMRNSLGSNWAVCNGQVVSPKITYSELYKNICSRTNGYYIPTLTMDTIFDSTFDVLTTSLDDSTGIYYFVVAYYQAKTIQIYAYDPFTDTRTLCGTLVYDSTTTASWSFGKDSYRAATTVSKLGGGYLFASLYGTNDNDTNQSTKYQVLWIWYKIGTSTINHKWSGELTYQATNLTLNMVGPLLEYTGDGFVELLLRDSATYTPYVKFPIEGGSINANNWTYDVIRSGGFSYPSSCWSSCWSSGENRMYFGMYNTSGSTAVQVYYFDWSTKTISSCTMGYTSDTSTISPLIKIDGGIYMLGSRYGYSIANGIASLLYNKTTLDNDVGDLNVFAVRKKDNKYYFLTCRLTGPTSNSTYGSIRVSDTFAGIYNKESTRITSGSVGYMLSMKSDAEFYLGDYGTSGYPIAMLPPAKVSYSSADVNPGQIVGSFVYIPAISLTHETNSSVPEIITTARYFVKLED